MSRYDEIRREYKALDDENESAIKEYASDFNHSERLEIVDKLNNKNCATALRNIDITLAMIYDKMCENKEG